MLPNNVRRVTNDHVNGKELPFWDAGVTLNLEYSPDPISQAVTRLRISDVEPAACAFCVEPNAGISTLKFQAMEIRSPPP